MIERRPYFVFVGMGLGMVLAVVLGGFCFVVLFGAMEVLLPGMVIGMAAGMWAGMAAAMRAVDSAQAGVIGAVIGVLLMAVIYGANARVGGTVAR